MRELLALPTSKLAGRHEGQGLVEYGLIIALVVVLAVAGVIIFGPSLLSLLSSLGMGV